MNKSATSNFTRRRFLATAGLALAAPAILTSCSTVGGHRRSASERINIGVIGCGGMGNGNTNNFLKMSDCRVVAACDVD